MVSCKASGTSKKDRFIVPMNTLTPPANPAQNARALLKSLQESYPVFRDCSPLVIGIDKQLLERLPDVDRKTLRIALGMHTNSLRYLKGMEKATHRLDLDGNAGAEVMSTHRNHATEVLRERFRKDAERRQAQREAEAQERQRSAKLRQLVEKFDKNR
jgi:ProP effector